MSSSNENKLWFFCDLVPERPALIFYFIIVFFFFINTQVSLPAFIHLDVRPAIVNQGSFTVCLGFLELWLI